MKKPNNSNRSVVEFLGKHVSFGVIALLLFLIYWPFLFLNKIYNTSNVWYNWEESFIYFTITAICFTLLLYYTLRITSRVKYVLTIVIFILLFFIEMILFFFSTPLLNYFIFEAGYTSLCSEKSLVIMDPNSKSGLTEVCGKITKILTSY